MWRVGGEAGEAWFWLYFPQECSVLSNRLVKPGEHRYRPHHKFEESRCLRFEIAQGLRWTWCPWFEILQYLRLGEKYFNNEASVKHLH